MTTPDHSLTTEASIAQCPVCQQSMQKVSKQWLCVNGHSFDIAKQGYCNLLLANQKKSANPGDDKKMLLARQHFLAADCYQPLAAALIQLVKEYCNKSHHVIDVGCGEGYYLAQLQQSDALDNAQGNAQFFGTDISKEALKLAARQYQAINWFVAAARRLPFLDHQVDLALNIFAPADWDELHRVIKPGGHVLLAVAGEEHLLQLRQMIYDQIKPHRPSRFLDKIGDKFELIASKSSHYELQLDDSETIQALLQMTPFYWQADPAQRKSIERLQSLNTAVNVQFYVLQA